jgi:lysophospholipase L1-like esterase
MVTARTVAATFTAAALTAFLTPPSAHAAEYDRPCGRIRAGSANVVVLGDSTGNERHEWVYLTAQRLARKYPAATVRYSPWGLASGRYLPSTVVHRGTASAVMHVWNASAAGQSSRYHTVRLNRMLPKNTALVLVSHGHNEDKNYTDPAAPYPADAARWRSQYEALTSAVRAARPSARICVVLQNPKTAPRTTMAERNSVYRSVAAARGYGVTDVHATFVSHVGWQVRWMTDATHPNAAGQRAWAARVDAQVVDGRP